jgi:A/G-specific adenine glycosylase
MISSLRGVRRRGNPSCLTERYDGLLRQTPRNDGKMKSSSNTATHSAQIKPSKLLTFHLALQHWYQAHGRHDLPWRNTRDPYHIWVSEIMLQQTQVATVRERYYAPFLKQFPTVEALAAAPREAVMKAWEGLGYYRRAGYLHEAAKKIVAGGGWRVASESGDETTRHISPATYHAIPDSLELLISLPGIGRNTAHAILAFAYQQPVAVMEANVKRIVARIFALTQPQENELWAGAEALLDRKNPFDYNQAMMDLGALICLPKAPRCGECPATSICKGKAQPTHYPQAKAKKKIPTRRVVILVREDAKGRLYLEQRETALLGGLYGFPQFAASHKGGRKLGTLTHIYSHFRLEATVRIERARASNSPSWYNRKDLARLPLSSLDRNVLKLLQRREDSSRKTTPARRAVDVKARDV